MNAKNLPGNWTSTENSLEDLAFLAKDALLTVDDFIPPGGQAGLQRFQAKADRVLRAQGNRSGRQRMRADGSLRPPRPPRGLILSTGEDIPQGQSLRARMLIIEVSAGDIDASKLTLCQRDAGAGLYAQSMAAYIAWLAPRYGELRSSLRSEVEAFRSKAIQGGHARTPEIVANLAVGLRYFLTFAQETGAITQEEAHGLWERGWKATIEAAQAQARHLLAAEPTRRYLELLSAALASGRAHLADMEGRVPPNPVACGWREQVTGTGAFERRLWQPQGDRIGWVEQGDLYLEPTAAYSIAMRMGNMGGEGITVSARTLNKRLHERGLLATVDETRGTNTVRRMIGKKREQVLHLRIETLIAGETDQTDQEDEQPAENKESPNGQNGEVRGNVPDLLTSKLTSTDQQTDQDGLQGNPTKTNHCTESGQDGQNGQLLEEEKPPIGSVEHTTAFANDDDLLGGRI